MWRRERAEQPAAEKRVRPRMLLAAVEEMGITISSAVHRWGCRATRRRGWLEAKLSSRWHPTRVTAII